MRPSDQARELVGTAPLWRRWVAGALVLALVGRAAWGLLDDLTAPSARADEQSPGRFERWSERPEERLARQLGDLSDTLRLVQERTPGRAHVMLVDALQPRSSVERAALAFWLYPRSLHAVAEPPAPPETLRLNSPPGSYLLVASEAGPYPFEEVGALLAEGPRHRLFLIGSGVKR